LHYFTELDSFGGRLRLMLLKPDLGL